jgi:hypothetical protein
MSSSTRVPTRAAAAALTSALAATLALASPTSASFDFASGPFSGKTSQRDQAGNYLPLQLNVSKNKKRVTVVFFELSAPPCGGGGMGTLQYAGLTARIKPDGSFIAKQDPYGSVKGNLDGRVAKGTARYRVSQGGVACDSGRVTWRARKSR